MELGSVPSWGSQTVPHLAAQSQMMWGWCRRCAERGVGGSELCQVLAGETAEGNRVFWQYDKRGAGFEVPHARRFRNHVAEKVSVI